MGWQFAVLLISALLASLLLSLWQHSAYIKVANEVAKANAGRRVTMVSGRSKGRLRGAIALLLVDPASGDIVDARAMVGATVFSRLRPAPQLLGPISGVTDRTENKHLKKAVESALAMLPGATRPQATSPAGTAGDPSRTLIRIPRTQTNPS